MATAAADQKHSAGLLERLQRRHFDAINSFQKQVRDMSSAVDSEEFSQLAELRTKLAMSRMECEEWIQEEIGRVAQHRRFLEESEANFLRRPIGSEVTPFADCVHRDGTNSIETRRALLAQRMQEVLLFGKKLFGAHQHRMQQIRLAEEQLKDCESRRKGSVQVSIEDLLHDLTSIAYADVTANQILVQRAAVAVNDQLLQNRLAGCTLISQLRQHELLKQREVGQRVSQLYQDVKDALLRSIVLWTQQFLCGAVFRAPSYRSALLSQIGHHFAGTKRDLLHVIEGVARLTESLEKTRENATPDEPGGTTSDGWLRTFNPDHHRPPFSQSPVIIAQETKVAVEVLIHHCQCKNAAFLSQCESGGQELLKRVSDVCQTLQDDISSLYTPKESEFDLIRSISPTPNDVFPFHTIVRDGAALKEAQDSAQASLANTTASIANEVGWFLEAVAHNLFAQQVRLASRFITGSRSIIGTLWDGTALLESVVAPVCELVRQLFADQTAMQKNYEDRLRELEEEYDLVEYELMHAGTVPAATQLCHRAMKLLEAIEAAHCDNHVERTDAMPTTMQRLTDLSNRLGMSLREALGVMPLDDAIKHNARVDLQATEREAQRAAAGNKKELLKELLQLPPLESKIAIDTSSCVNLSDGSVYLMARPTKLGAIEEIGDNAPQSINASEAALVPSKRDADAAKKNQVGRKGGQLAAAPVEVPTTDLVNPVVPEAMTESRLFEQRAQALLDLVFTREALFTEEQLGQLFQRLRNSILVWSAAFHRGCRSVVTAFCAATKQQLDERSNQLVRYHQRRAPTLQAHVYESRVRELQENSKSRAKYVTWLAQRLVNTKQRTAATLDGGQNSATNELQKLVAARKSLVTVMSLSALDTHKRAFGEAVKAAKSTIAKAAEGAKRQLEHDLSAVLHEVDAYSSDRLKTFEDGGSMSQDEYQAIRGQLEEIRKDAARLSTELTAGIDAAMQTQNANVEAEAAEYQLAHGENVAELKFFNHMQEQFAAVKARITGQLSGSTAAEGSLHKLVSDLEELLARSTVKREPVVVRSIANIDYEAAGELRDPKVEPDPTWQNDDIVLSNRLREARVVTEEIVKGSKAMQMMKLLDELRKHLVTRGLLLGCLSSSVEFQMIPNETYLEKGGAEAVDSAAPPAPTTTAPTAAASKKAPPAKGSKAQEKPKSSEGERPPDEFAFLRAPRMELQAQRWLTPMKEQLCTTAADYFKERPKPLLRPGVLGADLPAVLETINRRVSEQEARTVQHVAAAIKVYREQVQRIHLAVHRFAHELFIGLHNMAVEALDVRLTEAFRVFNVYETSLLSAKRSNNGVIKAAMIAPSNRGKLEALAAEEAVRQAKNLELLKKFDGVATREAQLECQALSNRLATAFESFAILCKAVVTPEHLIPGEEVVVGQHRGLKRLMRQKMKEDLAKHLEGSTMLEATVSSGAAKGKEAKKKEADAKRQDEKKRKDDGKGKGKGKGEVKEEEDAPLPVLERPSMEVTGVTLNACKIFEDFKRRNPTVTIRNHYIPPVQWENEKRRASEAAASTDGGKKAGAPTPKPSKAPAAKGGPPAVTENAPQQEVAPVVSPVVTVPKEKLFQQALLMRQQTQENFQVLAEEMARAISEKLAKLDRSERSWIESWNQAVATLTSKPH